MRLIKTFILRLYTDPGLPDLVCGDLQLLSARKTLSFKNTTELIEQLHQLLNKEVNESATQTSQVKNGPDFSSDQKTTE